jgi:hypothetical protein
MHLAGELCSTASDGICRQERNFLDICFAPYVVGCIAPRLMKVSLSAEGMSVMD